MLASLLRRLPVAEAPEVAAFYVRHNAALYVRAGHAVDLLLRDAEKLRTEWATGRIITDASPSKTQGNVEAARRFVERGSSP